MPTPPSLGKTFTPSASEREDFRACLKEIADIWTSLDKTDSGTRAVLVKNLRPLLTVHKQGASSDGVDEQAWMEAQIDAPLLLIQLTTHKRLEATEGKARGLKRRANAAGCISEMEPSLIDAIENHKDDRDLTAFECALADIERQIERYERAGSTPDNASLSVISAPKSFGQTPIINSDLPKNIANNSTVKCVYFPEVCEGKNASSEIVIFPQSLKGSNAVNPSGFKAFSGGGAVVKATSFNNNLVQNSSPKPKPKARRAAGGNNQLTPEDANQLHQAIIVAAKSGTPFNVGITINLEDSSAYRAIWPGGDADPDNPIRQRARQAAIDTLNQALQDIRKRFIPSLRYIYITECPHAGGRGLHVHGLLSGISGPRDIQALNKTLFSLFSNDPDDKSGCNLALVQSDALYRASKQSLRKVPVWITGLRGECFLDKPDLPLMSEADVWNTARYMLKSLPDSTKATFQGLYTSLGAIRANAIESETRPFQRQVDNFGVKHRIYSSREFSPANLAKQNLPNTDPGWLHADELKKRLTRHKQSNSHFPESENVIIYHPSSTKSASDEPARNTERDSTASVPDFGRWAYLAA